MPIYHPDARVTLGVVLESINDDDRPFAFPVRPSEITVFRNGYNEADTFSVSFSASHLPLTPELIRAASVEIYLFNKRNLIEQPETATKGEDADLFVAGGEVKPAIVGLVDDASMDYSDTGRMVNLVGRDYTALFLDQDWDARFRVQYKGRLDTVIQRLADDVPGSNGIINVRVEPQSLLASMPEVGRHESRANRKGFTFPNKANFWEVMSSTAVRYGFIIFVKGTDIILTTPRVYIEGKTGVLSMAWGKNLHDIHLSRKLGRERVPVIECISWDESKQQTVKGRSSTKKKSDKRSPGENANSLGTVKDEIEQYVIPGITSSEQLASIAEQVRQQKGRAEMQAQISTSDLEDLQGDQIFDISSGDAMQIKFEPFNSDMTIERLESELVKRGYEPDIAAKLSKATEEINELRQPMRVDNATIDFNLTDGITITASLRQFVNLVVQEENA